MTQKENECMNECAGDLIVVNDKTMVILHLNTQSYIQLLSRDVETRADAATLGVDGIKRGLMAPPCGEYRPTRNYKRWVT